MTPEFERWITEQWYRKDNQFIESRTPAEQASFWLSRIFAEIEREADEFKHFTKNAATGMAVADIKAKFGL